MVHAPQLLLIGAVIGVGIFHTLVPDHWVPIMLLARQGGWSRAEVAWAAMLAGTGHVLSTLAIGLLVWLAGVAVAKRFGALLQTASGVLLIVFGAWMAIGAWRELGDARRREADAHYHGAGEPDHEAGGTGKKSARITLLLILGSSPMVEGIPAFFAAGRYGPALIVTMALCFAVSTIATYVLTCIYSTAGLRRWHFPGLERYGEIASGTLISAVGLVFLFV